MPYPLPPAIYEPPADGKPARLRCPHCSSTGVVEVDRAVRWNPYDEGTTEPGILFFGTDGQADFEHDSWLCTDCNKTLNDPIELSLDYDDPRRVEVEYI